MSPAVPTAAALVGLCHAGGAGPVVEMLVVVVR